MPLCVLAAVPWLLSVFGLRLSLLSVWLLCLSVFLLGTRSLPALAGGCFSRVREVFICYLFRYFLGSFLSSSWGPCTANVGAFSVVPEVFSAVFFPRLSFFLLVVFCCSDLHRSVLQAVYPFFCLSYLAVDFLLVFHSSVCLLVLVGLW